MSSPSMERPTRTWERSRRRIGYTASPPPAIEHCRKEATAPPRKATSYRPHKEPPHRLQIRHVIKRRSEAQSQAAQPRPRLGTCSSLFTPTDATTPRAHQTACCPSATAHLSEHPRQDSRESTRQDCTAKSTPASVAPGHPRALLQKRRKERICHVPAGAASFAKSSSSSRPSPISNPCNEAAMRAVRCVEGWLQKRSASTATRSRIMRDAAKRISPNKVYPCTLTLSTHRSAEVLLRW